MLKLSNDRPISVKNASNFELGGSRVNLCQLKRRSNGHFTNAQFIQLNQNFKSTRMRCCLKCKRKLPKSSALLCKNRQDSNTSHTQTDFMKNSSNPVVNR